jgi:hypothetical protein
MDFKFLLRYHGGCTNHNRMLSKEAFNQADSRARWTRELEPELAQALGANKSHH